jgi:carboxypeptidase T
VAPGADATAYAMTDSPVGSYASSATKYCTMSAGADLTELVSGNLTYRAKWNLETDYDGVQLQVSVGGGAWTPVATARTQPGSGQGVQTAGQPWYEGAQAAWVTETVSLAPWLGQANVRFQFVLRTDVTVVADGFYFDTFLIQGEGLDPYSGADDVPAITRLTGVQPNPFNPAATVRFELAHAGRALVRVYDLSGRLVRTLVDEARPAGPQTVVWDGIDGQGQPAASGVYLVRLAADGVEQTVKASLVK